MDKPSQLIPFYPVPDLEAARHFYQDLLELSLYKDQGSVLIFEVCPGGAVGFCGYGEMPADPSAFFITLIVEDVDGWAQKLCQAGCRMLKAPTENPKFKIYQTLFQDPSGYTLEIQRVLD